MHIKQTYSFGKVAYNNPKIKNNLVEVEINLKIGKNYKGNQAFQFTTSASIWNSKMTDIIASGQILGELLPFLRDDEKFWKIYIGWKYWHMVRVDLGIPFDEGDTDSLQDCGCLRNETSMSSETSSKLLEEIKKLF